MNTRQVGKIGERIAVNYLKKRGYRIIATNWTCYSGEIDIVAEKQNLVFVEVKSAYSGLCSPDELFTYQKKLKLTRTIKKYLNVLIAEGENCPEWQVDLICITKNGPRFSLKHYDNVL